MKKKRLIAWLMAVAMVIGVFSPMGGMKKVEAKSGTFYVSIPGADAEGRGSSSHPYASIKYVFDNMQEGESATIILKKDVVVYEEAELKTGCTVTIKSDGSNKFMLKRANSMTEGSIIEVNDNGATLNIQNVILDGGVIWSDERENYVDPLERGNIPMAGGVLEGSSATPGPGDMDAALRITAGNVEMDGCTVQNNCNTFATYGDGYTAGKDAPRGGGGIHIDNAGSLTMINNCVVKDNYARHQGGGIWNQGVLKITDGEISGNRSEDWGGGIYQYTNDGANTVVKNVNVHNNSAKGSGGGINIFHGNFTISNSEVYGNYTDTTWNGGRALGGAGIRIEYAAGTVNLGSNVKVYGNSCEKKVDGYVPNTDPAEPEVFATGVMIDKTGVTVDSTFSVKGNFVANASDSTKPNVQYYNDEEDKKYYTPGTQEPEYNIGGVKPDISAAPTVSKPADVRVVQNGTKTMSVEDTAPEGTTYSITTYQWYEVDATGAKIGAVPSDKGGNTKTITVPSNELGEKYYICEVTCQETGKLPVTVSSTSQDETPSKANVYKLEANDFIIAKDGLNQLTDLKDTATDAGLKWNDGANGLPVEGSNLAAVTAKLTDDALSLSTIQNKKDGGEYEVEYQFTGTELTDNATANMFVVDKAGKLKDDDGTPYANQIGANNIVVSVDKAKQLKGDDDALKAALGTIVVDDGKKDDSKVGDVGATLPDGDDLATEGPHTVTLTYPGADSIEVTITVVDLTAKNFIVTVDDLETLRANQSGIVGTQYSNYADVEKNGTDVNPNDNITVTPKDNKTLDDMITAGAGHSYDITYTDPESEASTTVKMMVVSKSSDETPTQAGNDIELGADGITVNESEILGLSEDELKNFIKDNKKGNPVATDNGEEVDPDKIEVSKVDLYDDDGNLKTVPPTGGPGGPTVTFKYQDEEVTVPVTVIRDVKNPDGDDNTDDSEYPIIKADHFIISVDDAKKATDDDIKDASDAKLYEDLTKDGDPDKVAVDPDGKKALNDVTGTGDVEIKLTGKNSAGEDAVPVTVKAHVVDETASTKDPGTTSDSGKPVTIGANNITLTVDEAEKLQGLDGTVPASLKDKAGAVATSDGNPVPTTDIDVDKNEIKPTPGEYTVEFVYDGVKVPVKVTVVDSVLTAKDFEVPAGSPELSEDDFKKKADVVAKDPDGKEVSAKVDTDDLKKLNDAIKNNVPGVYEVKVSTPDGKKTETVKVTVKAPDDSGKTPEGDKPADTVGDDKTYEISNPQDIPQDLDKGRTVDKISLDGKDLPADSYVIDGDKLTIKPSALDGKPVGKYPVVITYKDGSKKTFNVNVIDYDPTTVVPLKKVPIFNMQKDIGVGKKFKLNLVGMNPNAYIDPKNTKTSNKKIATIDPKTLVIKANKRGKCNIQAAIIQNGSYYSVKIKLVVKKKMTMYNLKNAALVKKEGTLPEFNVYKRVVKGKKTKLKFTQVSKDAKVTYTSSNKKVATISNKGVIKGKKKGFTKVTAKIEQEGHVYYTRLFVRVDDGTTNKQLKKFLTTKVK